MIRENRRRCTVEPWEIAMVQYDEAQATISRRLRLAYGLFLVVVLLGAGAWPWVGVAHGGLSSKHAARHAGE